MTMTPTTKIRILISTRTSCRNLTRLLFISYVQRADAQWSEGLERGSSLAKQNEGKNDPNVCVATRWSELVARTCPRRAASLTQTASSTRSRPPHQTRVGTLRCVIARLFLLGHAEKSPQSLPQVVWTACKPSRRLFYFQTRDAA